MPPITLPALPGKPSITVPEITVPGLNSASCGLNSKIENLNSIKDKATAELKALTAGIGGISSSISSLASQISSSASDIIKSLNKNLLSDLPTVGLKLQDEFHSAIDSFGKGASLAALIKLKEIQKQFPNFEMQKALDAAGGILPVGAIPPNAAELIKGDLTKVVQNLQSVLPKIEKAAGSLAANATSLLSDAQKIAGDALSSITSESGITTSSPFGDIRVEASTRTVKGLISSISSVGTALDGAEKELLKLGAGGSLSATGGEISRFLNNTKDAVSGFSENLTKGIAKIPAFDICTAIPNQQVINGVVEEKAIPPIKPTQNAEPPTPPTPAPTPVVPKQPNRYAYPYWTKSIRDEFIDIFAPGVPGVPISNKIPLDPNGLAILEKAYIFLKPILDSNLELMKEWKASSEETPADVIAVVNDVVKAQSYLLKCVRFQKYRIDNNLIDKLK